MVLNLIALWKQEKVRPMTAEEMARPARPSAMPGADLMAGGTAGRLLAVVVLGTLGFNMQDVLLEPYGGEILGLSVGDDHLADRRSTPWARWLGFVLAARWLSARARHVPHGGARPPCRRSRPSAR